jgi:hypothetical protein
METVDLGRVARRVTLVPVKTAESSGGPVIVYERKRKRKKGTRALRGMEKLARRVARARNTYSTTYLERHEKSNEKKKDGWLRDRRYNRMRARRKAIKVLRKR